MPASGEEQHRVRERRKILVQMVLSGMDWQTIADRLFEGDVNHAYIDYRRAKEKSCAELNTSVEEARWLEVDRLDRLQAAVWPKALKGDTKAADTAHRLIVSRCKILGLEAPTKIMLDARMELESTVVAEAIIAAIDALGLEPGQRVIAFNAAQTRLELVSGSSEDDLDVG
jgi:hypothetical protein